VEELCLNEIFEHEGADRDVYTGQSLHLRRRQPHAWHLEVLGTYSIERLPIGKMILHGGTPTTGIQAAVMTLAPARNWRSAVVKIVAVFALRLDRDEVATSSGKLTALKKSRTVRCLTL
jgi:hypothetical protein